MRNCCGAGRGLSGQRVPDRQAHQRAGQPLHAHARVKQADGKANPVLLDKHRLPSQQGAQKQRRLAGSIAAAKVQGHRLIRELEALDAVQRIGVARGGGNNAKAA